MYKKRSYVLHLAPGGVRAPQRPRVSRSGARPQALLYARILLKADASSEYGPAWTDERVAEALQTRAPRRWPARERRRFSEETGSRDRAHAQEARQTQEEAPLGRGRAEAHLVALACSEPPEEG